MIFLYILLGVLAVFALLILAAVIKTAFIKAKPAEKCRTEISENELKTAEEKLRAMVQVPTVSKNEDEDLSRFYEYHQVLEREFPLLHKNLEKTVLRGSLLFLWKGRDREKLPILFMGHQDVVPASDESWIVPAYSGQVVDGALYGRGALDCKSTMYVEMQAVEELLAEGFQPPCDVYLSYSINEESGGDGAAGAVRYLQSKNIRLAFVLDEGGAVMDETIPGIDRPFAVIGLCEKGYADIKITARGKGGHSSTPPRNSTTARLFAFANEIERKRPFKKELLPEAVEMFRQMSPCLGFPMRLLLGNLWLFKPLILAIMPRVSPFGEAVMSTTCCFTQMCGSDAPNVIPKEPYLVANLRTSALQDVDESLAILKKYADRYDLDLEVIMSRNASPISNMHSDEYKFVCGCIKEQFNDAGVSPFIIMGGTDCRHFHALTENALRFAPVRMSTAQSASCHGINENVTLSAAAEGVRFYKLLLKNYKPVR